MLWPILIAVVAAYAVYKLFIFASADGDLAVVGSRLKPSYFTGKVVWVTGASSGSKSMGTSVRHLVLSQLRSRCRWSVFVVKGPLLAELQFPL